MNVFTTVKYFSGCANLLHLAFFHHRDTVGQHHRLDLVMGGGIKLAHTQLKANVFIDIQMRMKPTGLKNNRDIAVLWVHNVDSFAINTDVTVSGVFEPRYHAHSHRFTAARRL